MLPVIVLATVARPPLDLVVHHSSRTFLSPLLSNNVALDPVFLILVVDERLHLPAYIAILAGVAGRRFLRGRVVLGLGRDCLAVR